MQRISAATSVGRIVQVGSAAAYLHGGHTVLQTHGRLLEGAVPCTQRDAVRDALQRLRDRSVVIVSVSTLDVDEEMVGWMRFFTYSGHDVYVHSFSTRRLWYVDTVIR